MKKEKMEVLFRKPTTSTPFVLLDAKSGICELAGRSIPIDAENFYSPLLNWFYDLKTCPPKKLQFHIKLDFFNIASSKRLLNLFQVLLELQRQQIDIEVFWHYSHNDKEMLELGMDYSKILPDLNFVFKPDNVEMQSYFQQLKVGQAS